MNSWRYSLDKDGLVHQHSAEQEAEEILVEEGFAQPEDLEPEIAELLKEHHLRILEQLAEETD